MKNPEDFASAPDMRGALARAATPEADAARSALGVAAAMVATYQEPRPAPTRGFGGFRGH
jgi:hypothetical protein